MDALTEVLHDLRLSGGFYCRSELRAPWGLELPPRKCASFHFVAEGQCYLRASGEPMLLEAGDLAVLPHGRGHELGDTPDGPTQSVDGMPHEKLGDHAAVLRHGGDGERAC